VPVDVTRQGSRKASIEHTLHLDPGNGFTLRGGHASPVGVVCKIHQCSRHHLIVDLYTAQEVLKADLMHFKAKTVRSPPTAVYYLTTQQLLMQGQGHDQDLW